MTRHGVSLNLLICEWRARGARSRKRVAPTALGTPDGLNSQPCRAGLNSAAPPALNGGGWQRVAKQGRRARPAGDRRGEYIVPLQKQGRSAAEYSIIKERSALARRADGICPSLIRRQIAERASTGPKCRAGVHLYFSAESRPLASSGAVLPSMIAGHDPEASGSDPYKTAAYCETANREIGNPSWRSLRRRPISGRIFINL